MKYSIYIILLGILVACNNPKQQGKSLAEERAETDTILAFQGIKISEPLDSALYAKLTENGPIILYDKDKNSFALTTVTINDNVAYPDEVVHSLCLKGNLGKYYDFLSFICLYEESYGCFSYYQRLKQNGEKMGTFPIGKISQRSGEPWTRMDAISDFVQFGDSDQYKYDFVWEWRNQTIILSYNPQYNPNSSVTYLDTGYDQRQAEKEVQKMLKEAREREIDAARKRQQI